MNNCPCGSNQNFAMCCDIFIRGIALPKTPEELMRSRYSAYTLANIDYIEKTMKAPANKNFDAEQAKKWSGSVEWTGLQVVHATTNGDEGTVEFLANYIESSQKFVIHEISSFRKDDGKWFYISGKGSDRKASQSTKIKIARNDPCTCGSQIKFKNCCGKMQ